MKADARHCHPSAWTQIISAITYLGGDHRDTWAVGGVLSLPLGVSQYRQASAQKLAAKAAAEQSRSRQTRQRAPVSQPARRS